MRIVHQVSFSFFLALWLNIAIAQTAEQQAILDEGNRLYLSEITSWYGSDTFLERCHEKVARAKGYISYPDSIGYACHFISAETPPVVLATIRLDHTNLPKNASVDTLARSLTPLETTLWSIRQTSLAEVNKNQDGIFKFYKDTNYNFIPLSDDLGNRVYILTGPKSNGEVILGNDYLLTFDKTNRLQNISKIHEGIFRLPYGQDEAGRPVVGGVHTHIASAGNYFTPTDVCTLRLYGPSTHWIMHVLITENEKYEWRFPMNKILKTELKN